MEYSLLSLVSEVKNEIFCELLGNNGDAFLSPSAYDTAWLAMIPHQNNHKTPMFPSCLNWIMGNQKEGGFWGETNEEGLPTIDALPATLACLLALQKWNHDEDDDAAHQNIQSAGLRFIESKAEILVKINYHNLPRWFLLTFPAMIELAEAQHLPLVFPNGLLALIANIFVSRHHILQTEKLVEGEECPPLLSYLETLPSTYDFDRQETISRYLCSDGSLFQSPSATAQAFISTQNIQSLKYLQSLIHKFPNGVPAIYPVDGDIIKLCMVDHVEGLGLAPHFNQQIQHLVAQVYRNQKNNKSNGIGSHSIPFKLFKDALAFRLLRMHGHDVNPGSFCWFLYEPQTMAYMEQNSENFITAMYSVYRATDLSFPGEHQLEEARKFATKLIQNAKTRHRDHNFLISKGLQNMMKYELDIPWTARLDRLYHRKWIEENKSSSLWVGKASFYRLSCLDNTKLMELAVENFEYMRLIYMRELEELKGWSKKWRLSEMGFGREKTVYTYFAVASSSNFPEESAMRLIIAKAAIIVTVADDFYDMEGSLAELEILTDAVERWDGEGLEGHSKTIFEALDDFANEIVAKCEGTNIVPNLQHLWRECFISWMEEKRWSVTGYTPAMDEYLERGMASIAAHTITLPATTFFTQNATNPTHVDEYQNITKLLMAIARLANDMQSYQKELVDGKMNMVVLHWNQNPKGSIQESVVYVREMLEVKRKEFLQHVFSPSLDEEMSKPCKQTHLYCMKVFEMFFNSANHFDNETTLVEDINKSIYLPITFHRNRNHKSMVSARARLKPPRIANYINNFSRPHIPIRFNMRFLALPL